MSFRKLFAALTSLLTISFCAYLMLLGSGFFPEPDAQTVLLLSVALIFLSCHRYSFGFLLVPIVGIYAFYTPTGLTFGPPSYPYVASAFATDFHETKEFLGQIPWLHYLASLGILASLILYRCLYCRFELNFAKNPIFLTACGLGILFSSPASTFLLKGGKAIWEVQQELRRLNSMAIASEWGSSSLSEKSVYDDYILVIGESARRDYHHAYGYPAENTPFMSHANGILIEGLTAGGTNTIASLKLMLTKPDTAKWEGDYRYSLVDLVKSAGISTFWLSNHGYLGNFDTPISSIANKSDEKRFLKAGDNDFKEDVSDLAILPEFDALLSRPHNGKRFIVVHLYGSHPIACDRVKDYPMLFNEQNVPARYRNIHCYISSIKKTDEILAKLHQRLTQQRQSNGRRFSMIYFSDHGLAHQMGEKEIDINNISGKSRLHLDVPLFKTSSDDTERREYKAFKSGLNFTDGIGHWLGIQNPKLNPQVDLFSPQDDPSDYGLKEILEGFNPELDPAVVIPLP